MTTASNGAIKKESTFKLIESDPKSINLNQINNSSSKMQYSVPKSKRFEWEGQKINPEGKSKFYDLPELNTKRSPSFGYGNKTPIGQLKPKSPPPGSYYIRSDFQLNKKNGITMGAGRQVVRSNSLFDVKESSKVPGPGQFNPQLLEHSRSFSMASRIEDKSDKWIKSVPGPGNYQPLYLINKNMRNPNSKFNNSPSPRIPRQARRSQVEQITRIKKIPGPGQYNTVEIDSIAKFKHLGGSRFPGTKRHGIIDQTKLKTPGPGSYKNFSEFIY